MIGRSVFVARISTAGYRGAAKEKNKTRTEVWAKSVRAAARTATLSMLRDLAARRRTRAEKKFLRGILNKRSFYTYYGPGRGLKLRSANLDKAAQQWRKELGKTSGPDHVPVLSR